MKKSVVIAIGVLLLVVAFLAGSWFQKQRLSGNPSAGVRSILYYVDPMHPSYKSDKPGIAPDCGMKLEPVYADGGGSGAGTTGDPASLVPGTVRISADRQQLIGVKVGTVEKKKISQQVRVLGRITVDETRIYQIRSVVNGWIRETSSIAAGSLVKKDQILASFYSPEFLGAEQAYIFALNSLDRFVASGKETSQQLVLTDANIQQYKDSLINLGMSDMQVDEIAKTRQRTQNIYIVAPASGFILSRNVSLNQRFERGTELFKLADLSRVWILADIFENEAQFLSPGVVAKVTLPYQNVTFTARVGNTLPQFDPSSRTLKVRLEAENPGYVLKPDMFVDVDLQINHQPAIAVPVDAVVDTGLRKVVFVDRGNGTFEPRRVETGWRRGGLVEITRGLMDKEHIVVSGTFMIDSESRMQAAAMGIYDEGIMDPVCGMYIDEKRAKASGKTVKFGGNAYYFCSPECQHDFVRNPRIYLGQSETHHTADRQKEDQYKEGQHREEQHNGLQHTEEHRKEEQLVDKQLMDQLRMEEQLREEEQNEAKREIMSAGTATLPAPTHD